MVPFQEKILKICHEDSTTRKEDLELKKNLLDQFRSSEQSFQKSMQDFSAMMARTMSEGFLMMSSMLRQDGRASPLQLYVYAGNPERQKEPYYGNHLQHENLQPQRNFVSNDLSQTYTEL